MTQERELRLLEENDALRQRVAELEAVTENKFEFPEAWNLTRSNTRILSSLLAAEFLTEDQVGRLREGCETGNRPWVCQMICLLRKRLTPLGIKIELKHGIGYRISVSNKASLRRYACQQ